MNANVLENITKSNYRRIGGGLVPSSGDGRNFSPTKFSNFGKKNSISTPIHIGLSHASNNTTSPNIEGTNAYGPSQPQILGGPAAVPRSRSPPMCRRQVSTNISLYKKSGTILGDKIWPMALHDLRNHIPIFIVSLFAPI